MMAQVGFAGSRLDSQRRCSQKIVGAMHAPFRRRFLVLLDSHGQTPFFNFASTANGDGSCSSCDDNG